MRDFAKLKCLTVFRGFLSKEKDQKTCSDVELKKTEIFFICPGI